MATGINKADVMRKAWTLYRSARTVIEAKALAKGFRANARRWSNCLRDAWAMAKEAARVAALDTADRAAEIRIAALALVLDAEMAEPSHRGPLNVVAIHAARVRLDQFAA